MINSGSTYVQFAVYALTDVGTSTNTTIIIESTDFISNTGTGRQDDGPLVKSENDGSYIEMTKNQFIENTMSLVRFYNHVFLFVSYNHI
jgi:hypothetical protein